jgi:hypothetical protein
VEHHVEAAPLQENTDSPQQGYDHVEVAKADDPVFVLQVQLEESGS